MLQLPIKEEDALELLKETTENTANVIKDQDQHLVHPQAPGY